ncbi:hypothetical protein CHS0354_026393 [Potamilus streckersoni]|uniref:Mitochondria-eating protein C-terminal domain-containing protein n=1 Tax=Potamilus streckersoni TaxID=2493646 RepID=A0AAE0W731_9BIVA|nr:hypothetical protein CHS0354_026393 [Potamilus streckersoni]
MEDRIKEIDGILTDLENNDFSNFTSFRVARAKKGLQFISKPDILPQTENVSFIVDFLQEHLKKNGWKDETETINHVKLDFLEGARQEIDACKLRLKELKEQGFSSFDKGDISWRSSMESLNQFPTPSMLNQTITEDEEDSMGRNSIRTQKDTSPSINIEETTEELKRTILERDKTIKHLDKKLKTYEGQLALMNEDHDNTKSTPLSIDSKENETVNELKRMLAERDETIRQQDNKFHNYEEQVLKMTKTNEGAIQTLMKNVKDRDEKIAQLEKKLNTYDQFETVARSTVSIRATVEEDEKTEQDLREENKRLLGKVEDLSTRLSKISNEVMKFDNPHITDLIDPNRPQILVEKFTDLFHNEWQNAREECMKQELSEDEVISSLLKILMISYTTCLEASETQLKHLKTTLEKEMIYLHKDIEMSPVPHQQSILNDASQNVHELRKRVAVVSIPMLKKSIKKQIEGDPKLSFVRDNKVTDYLDRCIEVTWMMCIQNPPITLTVCEPGTTLDTEIFQPYGNSGTVVRYCVWPAVRLSKNGQLITKGSAQTK